MDPQDTFHLLQNTLPAEFLNELAGYISVDVETAGPNPRDYALLSIGACTLFAPRKTFSIELVPTTDQIDQQALSISGLSIAKLQNEGTPPAQAMACFASWLKESLPQGIKPVFTAFNAPFDWSFINDYFHHFYHSNPFGHTALDMRAFFMVVNATTWQKASFTEASHHYLQKRPLQHNALQDALDQADLLINLLLERYTREGNEYVSQT